MHSFLNAPSQKTDPDGLPQPDKTSPSTSTQVEDVQCVIEKAILNLFLILFLPALFGIWWVALEFHDCSLWEALRHIGSDPAILLYRYRPPSLPVAFYFATWIAFQATLFTILPGTITIGQPTPAGERLCYRLNGFKCWLVTVLTFQLLWVAGVIDLHFIALNWSDFLSASTYYAWILAVLALFKAHLAPSHLMDRKFSGNFFTDLYNGIELNPRVGKYWDVKLFHNGHCAMTGWTLIDISFIALQYQRYGFITNSILIVSLIRGLVSVDFLWNEDWYLRSIDVCEEPFGFYFAFGSGFFLQFMYTLQSQYLVRYPVSLSHGTSIFLLLLGGAGYGLYYLASDQKNTARKTRGNFIVHGKRVKCIKAQFVTKDGVTQESLLIYSGVWGVVRHPNYVGALLMTLAMGGVCGLNSLLPWTESIFATVFLTMRSMRDDAKCARKYGHHWDLYREKVKWNFVPGVF